jgi:hypothetical protein
MREGCAISAGRNADKLKAIAKFEITDVANLAVAAKSRRRPFLSLC